MVAAAYILLQISLMLRPYQPIALQLRGVPQGEGNPARRDGQVGEQRPTSTQTCRLDLHLLHLLDRFRLLDRASVHDRLCPVRTIRAVAVRATAVRKESRDKTTTADRDQLSRIQVTLEPVLGLAAPRVRLAEPRG